MITRITPEKVETFTWNKYVSELKQDWLHMKAGKSYQFIFVLDYKFKKGGTGPLFILGSNLKAYWQADEIKQLESDYIRTYLHGSTTLLDDKKTLELDIKKGGIIKSNRQVIEIEFRKIFRALGYGNWRIAFKGIKKERPTRSNVDEMPTSLVEKIEYARRKPPRIEALKKQAIEADVFPQEKFEAIEAELKLAYSRNNLHKIVEWLYEMESLLVGALSEYDH